MKNKNIFYKNVVEYIYKNVLSKLKDLVII